MITFEQAIEKPEIWLSHSWQLYYSGLMLSEQFRLDFENPKIHGNSHDGHKQVGYMSSAQLLIGLAVENALKGAIISKQPKLVENGKFDIKKIGGGKNNHGLNDLAENAQISMSPSRKDLLDRLTIYVIWAGKYGAPFKEIDYKNAQQKKSLTLKFPSDLTIAREIIEECEIKAGYEKQKGWPLWDI